MEDFIALDPISQLTNNWLAEFNIWTIIIRLALAFIIGASFGFERSRKDIPLALEHLPLWRYSPQSRPYLMFISWPTSKWSSQPSQPLLY